MYSLIVLEHKKKHPTRHLSTLPRTRASSSCPCHSPENRHTQRRLTDEKTAGWRGHGPCPVRLRFWLSAQAPGSRTSPSPSPGASGLWRFLSPFLYPLAVTPAGAAQRGQDRMCADFCPSQGSEFSMVTVLPSRCDERHMLPRYKHGLCKCVWSSSRKGPVT